MGSLSCETTRPAGILPGDLRTNVGLGVAGKLT